MRACVTLLAHWCLPLKEGMLFYIDFKHNNGTREAPMQIPQHEMSLEELSDKMTWVFPS